MTYIAITLSVLGSFYVTSADRVTRLRAFQLWLVANSLWIVHGVARDDWFVVAMFAAYLISTIKGIWTNRKN